MRCLCSTVLLFGLAVCAAAGEKPYAFGRFGFSNDDGLLTMDANPGGFTVRNRDAAPSSVSWREMTRVESVSATEKTLVNPASPDGPKSVRYTLLYPGVETKWGTKVSFSLPVGPGQQACIAIDGGAMAAPPEGWIVLRAPDVVVRSVANTPTTPIIITFDPLPKRIRMFQRTAGASALTLQAESARPLTVRFTVPTLARPPLANAASVRAFLRLVDTHAPIPRLVRETYRLDRNAGTVTITDEYTPAGALIVIPPVLAFAASHRYPIKPLAPGPLFCKYGPLVFGGSNGRLTYTLPVPPIPERGYLRPAAGDKLLPLLNEVCGHWPAAWCRNGVDLGYAGVTGAAMAWNLLTHENRAKARAAWDRYLDSALDLPPYAAEARLKPWKTMTDPLSGKSFFWGYSIENRGRQCDLEWGIGLPLYGLHKYGTVTGDWGRVKSLWPAAQRLAGYFDLADDYAWMTVCNAQDGYSTGTGDALNAAYAGMTAMLGTARHLNDNVAEGKYAYRLARMALATSMRPAYTRWARAHGLLGPTEAALGFWEAGDSFTPGDLLGDPWSTTTLLSGNGCLPELMSLYATTQPTAWKGFLDEYARYFPEWYAADHVYDHPTTYNGNSGYVTYPHLFARAWFGAAQEDLRDWLAAAQTNRNNAWVGPNAIAEIITQQAPVVMTDWGNAPIPTGTYTPRFAEIRVDARTATTLRLGLRRDVDAVTVNGRPWPFTEQGTRSGTDALIWLPKGRHTVRIAFFGT